MAQQWFKLSFSEDCQVDSPLEVDQDNLILFGIDSYDLEQGNRFEKWPPNVSLRSSKPEYDGIPDDVLWAIGMIPTFSPRLQAALADANVGTNDIQYLKARVFQSTGKEVKGFAYANVLSRIPALDYKHSVKLDSDEPEFDPETGELNTGNVWTEALKASEIEGYDIIRLSEVFPPVFVSERFVKVIRDGHFTGASLNAVPVVNQ